MTLWLGRVAIFLGLLGVLALPVGAQGASGVDDGQALRASLAHLQARASQWGIQNASQEFRLRKVVRDSLGQTHVRLDQVHQTHQAEGVGLGHRSPVAVGFALSHRGPPAARPPPPVIRSASAVALRAASA